MLEYIDNQLQLIVNDLENENKLLRAFLQLQPKPRFIKIGFRTFAVDEIAKVNAEPGHAKLWTKSSLAGGDSTPHEFTGEEADMLTAWVATESVDLATIYGGDLDEHPF